MSLEGSMPRTTVYRPANLPAYLGLIEKLQRKVRYSIWYRGCGEASSPLIPFLYRHKSKKQEDFFALERGLMARFRQRSIPYHTRDLKDDLDALFFMQHYGVPTRLLDWTENPLIALHFALMSAPKSIRRNGTIYYRGEAAVWILDPYAWNSRALNDLSHNTGPLTSSDESLKAYYPSAAPAMRRYPVALFGAHNSSRIVAQQGVFVIFGKERIPMEKLLIDRNFRGNELMKVTIAHHRIPAMRKSLLNHGITESVVFPDLEGLARETRRYFGFED